MNNTEKVILGLVIFMFIGIAAYNFARESRINSLIYERSVVCEALTFKLKELVNNSNESSYVDYYCYYSPYTPPKGMEGITKTLCICEGKLASGEIRSVQVLTAINNNVTSYGY